MEEPMVQCRDHGHDRIHRSIMQLCEERRGITWHGIYGRDKSTVQYDLPLNEIIYDFFDALKSRSRGYASFDYEMQGYSSRTCQTGYSGKREEVDAFPLLYLKDRV